MILFYTLSIFSVISSIFDTLVTFTKAAFKLAVNMIHSIITIIPVIGNSIQLPFDIMVLVHPLLGACIGLVVGVSIVKLLLGWGNA